MKPLSADEINANIEANRQAILRNLARNNAKELPKGLRFIAPDAEYDQIHGAGGTLLVEREKWKPCYVPDGEYGS